MNTFQIAATFLAVLALMAPMASACTPREIAYKECGTKCNHLLIEMAYNPEWKPCFESCLVEKGFKPPKHYKAKYFGG